MSPAMNPPSRIRTFRHRFKGGITCELAVDLGKLSAGETGYLCCEWSARPKPRVIPEYRRWILSVWQLVADETGGTIMELLQVERHLWETWLFKPGYAPVKIREVSA
jgi:hypothetical protein